LSVATVVSLIPALVTLSSVVFPLVAALGGFVAVAGALVGIGLGGTLAAISANTELLKEEFTELVSTLSDAFAPVAGTATAVLLELIREFEEIIPALVPARETIRELGDSFTELGTAVIDLLPAFVDLAVTLTSEFLPPFTDFVENVGPQLPGIIQGLVSDFRQLLPTIRRVGRFLGEFIPEFTRFGFLVLSTIGPAIGFLGQVLLTTTQRINELDRSLGQLVAGGSILLPVLTGLVSLLGGPLTLALAGVIAGVAGVARAFQTNFAGIRDDITRFVGLVQGILPAARQAFESFLTGVDLGGIQSEIDALVSVLDQQLTQTLIALQPVFNDVQSLLEDNKEEFRVIGSVIGGAVEGLITLARVGISVLAPAFRSILIPVLRGFIDVIDFGLTKLSQFIQIADAIKNQDIDAAISEANQLFGGGPNPELNVSLPNQQQTQEVRNNIEVVVEGELPEDSIRDVTTNELDKQSDQAQRNTGSFGIGR
jgi:phage-related protein